MNKFWQFLLFIGVIICLFLGGILVDQYLLRNNKIDDNMHTFLHKQLGLSKEQDKNIADIEREFALKKNNIEKKIKQANIDLADAIKESGFESAKAKTAIDKIHDAMGEMQKLSLKHLADMESSLTEQQKEKLKEKIVEQLYKNAGK